MRTKLNLANRPFRNRALPWTITAIVSCVSLVMLVFIIGESRATSARAEAAARDLAALRQQEAALIEDAAKIREALTPEQRQLLDAAHMLVDRKRFSWSRLFADLEAALPGNVRVTRINVRDVFARGGATWASLELSVMSKATTDVTNMMAEMDRSGVFQTQLREQNLQKDRSASGTEWTLEVAYRPRAGMPTNTEGNQSVATAAASEGAR